MALLENFSDGAVFYCLVECPAKFSGSYWYINLGHLLSRYSSSLPHGLLLFFISKLFPSAPASAPDGSRLPV